MGEAQALDQSCLWRLQVRRLRAHADRARLPHRGAEVREAGARGEDVGHQGAQRQEDQEEMKRMLLDERSVLSELRRNSFGGKVRESSRAAEKSRDLLRLVDFE